MPKLNARALKVTCVLNPEELVAIDAGVVPRAALNVAVPEFGAVVADVAAKSLRKAQAMISEHGVDRVAVIIQGKLISGNKITEAGLVAQVKVQRAVAAEAAA